MDPNRGIPYFPPPPGQQGVPPPLPPRLVSPATTHYAPPPNTHASYQPVQPHPASHTYGGNVPAAGVSYSPAPTPHLDVTHSHIAGPQGYHPGSWQPQPQLCASSPYGQQYGSPTAHTYQVPGAVPLTPTTGSAPTMPQKATSQPFYSNLNTQKVLNSYKDIKNKARTKLSQYLVQPVQQPPQSGVHMVPPKNENVNFPPAPLVSPGHSHLPSQAQHHYPQMAQSQYEMPLAVSHPAAQTPSSQFHSYSSPAQHQSFQIPPAPVSPVVSVQQQHYLGTHSPAPGPRPVNESHLNHAPNVQATISSTPYYSEGNPAHSEQAFPAVVNDRTSSQYSNRLPISPEEPFKGPTLAVTSVLSSGTQATLPSDHAQQIYYLSPPPPPPPNTRPPADISSQLQQDSAQAVLHAPINSSQEGPSTLFEAAAPYPGPIQHPARLDTPESEAHQTTASEIDKISSQLGGVSLQNTAPPVAVHLGPEHEDFHEWKRPIPAVSDDGLLNDVIWECPEQRVIDYESEWYHLPDVPDFLVCTRCHEMYLSQTSLSTLFERIGRPTGRCRFNVPRITRALYPEYLKTKDAQPIRDFMTKRLGIQDCHGKDGVNGAAGVKWFRPLDERLNGVISCEACHEDVVIGTSFSQSFSTYDEVQAADVTWACDVCLPFIARSLVKHSRLPGFSWEDWVQAAVKHVNLPKCEKIPVSPTSRRFLQPRGQRAQEIKICEKCYEETLAFTPLGLDFELVAQEPSATGLDWMDVALGYRTKEPDAFLCSATSFPVCVAIEAAKSQRDIDVFLGAAETIIACPPCTDAGISNGVWYTLAGDACEDYMICAACYAGYISTWKLDRFFQRVTGLDSSQAFLCSFQRSAPRWFEHMSRMEEGIETGVWSRYSGWVRKFSSIPPCAKESQVGNRKWYGWDDCTICPECYVTFCKDSSPAPGVKMDYDKQLVADTRMCCMYSPRMRQRWIEACEKGSGDELVEFSRLRHGVYVQTVMQAQMLREMQTMQMMNAMHAGFMSTIYQGIEGMKVVSGTTDGHMHGNSTLGWHETEEGATSVAFRNQMSAGMSQSNSAGTWMTIFQLTQKWKEFE